jgi:hypothetical protein
MRREVFNEDHEVFRAEFRRFAESELAPKVEKWNADGVTETHDWGVSERAGGL